MIPENNKVKEISLMNSAKKRCIYFGQRRFWNTSLKEMKVFKETSLLAAKIWELGCLAVRKTIQKHLALHKIVRIRHRYLYTPANTLRLRYAILSGASIACFSIFMMAWLIDNVSLNIQAENSILAKNTHQNADTFQVASLLSSDQYTPNSDKNYNISASKASYKEAYKNKQQGKTISTEDPSAKLSSNEILKDADQKALILSGNKKEKEAAQKESLFAKAFHRGIGSVSNIMKAPPAPKEHVITVKPGGTLGQVLSKVGLSSQQAYKITQAMHKHYDPKQIKAGQVISLHFDPITEQENTTYEFSKLHMKLGPIKEVLVTRNSEDKYEGQLLEKEVSLEKYAFSTKIETSLYGSAAKAGIPMPMIANMIRIYSWGVDFQRDIRPGDKVEILYEVYETEDGEFAKFGDIIYANLGVGGRDKPIYRYKMKDGMVDFFEPDGMSIRKTLMRTPIDGARLSSGYGMRKHPILGYNKMHKGVDFAAPIGTPIYAAGDGVVEKAGRNGGYGNYIRIRHNSTLKTAYAHLHKFVKSMHVGKQVRQGDVIGYVGNTGRSTGPHLHYEVLVKGVQKNPRSIDLPTGEQLKSAELTKFKTRMKSINQLYSSLAGTMKFAQNANPKPHSQIIH